MKKPIKGSSTFQLVRKTKLLKNETKKWKKDCRIRENNEMDGIKKDIGTNQECLMTGTTDVAI